MPTAITRRRDPVRSTSASRIDNAHSEHGLKPSTNAINRVLTNNEVEPTSRSPNNGRSITSAAIGASPPSNAAATATSICLATESLNPTHISSPNSVVGTPDGSSPRSARSSIMTSRFASECQTS